ncbi:4035_t:CDS:10 [Diversispora eburnea]|uniref:4035_t:CDS:1 n=1 Tax=Diversispora eburnea TaxID=1213867 RepID=A0A9N9A0C1_9GLOM|nr:4035_t:CDS:10 [Diversispora eburnea]
MEEMSQQDKAAAFVDWVNTFDKISRPVNSIHDLIDGVVLIEILCIIDPKWFKMANDIPRENNWVQIFNKLKRLYPFIKKYYEDVLGLSFNNVESPNLNSIAKDGDINETLKLCSLVLTLAVRSSQNEVYIEKILSLGQKSQKGLMESIENVMNRLGESTVQLNQQPLEIASDDELRRLAIEHRKLISEKEALEKAHQVLIDEHTKLRGQCDDLQAEIEELSQKLKDSELTVSQSTQSGKSDFYMRNEIDNLRHELQTKRHETGLLIEKQNVAISELTKKVEILQEQADEASRLKDQLDEYRHAAEKLKKTENVIEKYKKKLEEGADVRRSLKTLEQENRNLIEKNQEIEEEYNKMSGYRNLIENYKQQIDDLQTEKTELLNVKNKIEYEDNKMRAKLDQYESLQSRDAETIRLLEERLLELKLGEGGLGRGERRLEEDEEKADADEIDQSIGDSELSDALKGTTMTSLKLKVNELERELTRYREGKSADGDDAQLLVLQHMLEDANLQQEKLVLENQLTQLQNGNSTTNGVDKYESKKNIDKEQELSDTKRKLIDAQIKLERAEKEMNEMKSDSTIDARIKDLEAEKDVLKNQNEELTSLIKSLRGGNDDVIQLHRQQADKIKNLKQLITGQHEIIENYKGRELEVQAERQAHTEEIALSSWFNLGRRVQGDSVFLQRNQTRSSFLHQQRQILDTQLKRR